MRRWAGPRLALALRRRLTHAWVRLPQRIGRRGAALLCLGITDIVYGYWLSADSEPTSATKQWFAQLMPLFAWAVVWWVVAALCIVNAFIRRDTAGFAAAVAIKITWATMALAGWLQGEVSIAAIGVWSLLTALVSIIAGWREPIYRSRGGS